MKKKKIRLHPALVFLILTIGIMIISSIGSILNLETSYYVVNEATGDLNSQVVNINNLFISKKSIIFVVPSFCVCRSPL